ncbi:metal dependent phosphohydrolase [Thermodesulfatator indicus DSM 15286]|uniref:Metal dependent phosphohydrolase n=1 Tax=Thermodesulfatator indicus (strain DSM 15286 / JCM 11887 / CIR29812) TaxID=667014 RepID=F8AE18_THEID|nr:HDOD domain-containing protein [Thermodesulfatator indicus]AEH44988.1 metal dependent phosphohydrolase [Thermodesulfatator indicus DSM 15286]
MPQLYLPIAIIIVFFILLFFFTRKRDSNFKKENILIPLETNNGGQNRIPNEDLPKEVKKNKIYYQKLLKKRRSLQIYKLDKFAIKTSRELNTNQKEFLYKELKKFPLPSGAAWQLSEMLRDPLVDSKEVAALASTDPVISGRLLALVNSAYFRPSSGNNITSIHHAILYLGFNQVRNLLFQLMLEQTINKHSPLPKEEINKIWLHSAAVSVAAGEIAKRLQEHPGLALTAGLMHDVGKFFLPYFKQEDTGSLLLHEDTEDLPPIISEENVTGFSHPVIGEVLCYIWRLPKEIAKTVAYHHFGDFKRIEKLSSKEKKVIITVALADYICHLLGYAEEEPFLYEIPKEALKSCGFPVCPEFLITPQLEKEIEKMIKLLKGYTT